MMSRACSLSIFAALGTVVLFVSSRAYQAENPSKPPSTIGTFTYTASPDPALPPLSMLVRILTLTPEQEQKLKKLYEEHNKGYAEILQGKLPATERQAKLRELRKGFQQKLEAALTPQQMRMLRNLDAEAMLVDRLTVVLKLTAEQSKQLLEVLREQSAGIRTVEKEARQNNWTEEQQRQKLAELRKQIDEKVNKILSPEQQQKLKEVLQGEGSKPATPTKSDEAPKP